MGKVWGGAPGMPSLPFDVAGAAVVKTLIGPIFGGVSGGDSGHYAWFFGLGRIF
jgi:NTE family protein